MIQLRKLALLAVALMLAASPALAGELRGTAFYRERMALPPGATFEIVLENISLADAPAVVIGKFGPVPARVPPFRFAIRYRDAAVKGPAHFYNLRASVRLNGRLLFTTTQATFPFPRRGKLSVPMQRVE